MAASPGYSVVIDVEPGVIFRHLKPDLLDGRLLAGAEAAGLPSVSQGGATMFVPPLWVAVSRCRKSVPSKSGKIFLVELDLLSQQGKFGINESACGITVVLVSPPRAPILHTQCKLPCGSSRSESGGTDRAIPPLISDNAPPLPATAGPTAIAASPCSPPGRNTRHWRPRADGRV